jgi:hypothetical protein
VWVRQLRQTLFPGGTEDSARAFLVDHGFVEVSRCNGEGNWELEQIAEIFHL